MSDNRSDWEKHVEDVKGHTLRRGADGDIDSFVVDAGFHNGPGCIVCGDDWCEHCTSAEDVEPCPGGEEKRARDEAKAALDRLHDAAPDLLEAMNPQGLEFAADCLERLERAPRVVERLRNMAANQRAAIASATGEAG